MRLVCLVALPRPPPSAQTFNAQEQAEIRAIVRDYLVRNPDVLREALDALAERASRRALAADRNPTRATSPWAPPMRRSRSSSSSTIAAPIATPRCEWVTDVARTRRDVRFVFKELPILSAPRWKPRAPRSRRMPQGRYWQFHHALMGFRGDLTSARHRRSSRAQPASTWRACAARMESRSDHALLEQNRAHAIEYNITAHAGLRHQWRTGRWLQSPAA